MPQPPQPSRRLSDAEVEALVERVAARAAREASARAAREAVDDVFRSLGLDVRDPSDLVSWHADRQWTRAAREGSSRLGLSVKTTVIGSLVTAVLALIWSALQNGPPGAP
ncbi:hypothetical protein LOS78_12685 [Paracoccus sp. MA]|uniref:hypothetical protein n=1 Tax=Paracoccus sp. MA TaxID=2895796 RepID=UPI001E5BBA57|nr:hypothetical protein [Paracoccus sp. MA]UFM66782.1 hypothetical protein LOS78_12685 [Paracoccus sp. MA]